LEHAINTFTWENSMILASLTARNSRRSRNNSQRGCLSIEQMEPRRMMFATYVGQGDPNGVWGTTNLSYSFSNFLDHAAGWAGGLLRADMQNAVEEAMGVWTAVTPLRFFQRADSGPAPSDDDYDAGSHPTIRWGHHDIASPTPPLVVLAHALRPGTGGRNGDPHYNDTIGWTINEILETGAHEFGHAIGLAHANGDTVGSTCPASIPAIMDACAGSFSYNGLESAYLLPDDIAGVRSLYGNGLGYVIDSFGEINIYGTRDNDVLTVDVSGGNITVTSAIINGAFTGSFTRALNDGQTTLNSIQLHGLDGNDILRVENTNGIRTNLYGGAGDDFFDIGFARRDFDGIGETQIFAGMGTDSLFAYDNFNDTAQTYIDTGARIERPGWTGVRYFSDLENRTLWTGSSADTVNVWNTEAHQGLVLASGGGRDTVNLGTSSIGLREIRGDVQIQNDPSFTTLNINDGPNTTPRTATFDVGNGFGFVTGLAPATIFWDTADIDSINVTNGSGVDTNLVWRNSETLNFNNSGGNDIINIGSLFATGLQQITGPITIDNTPALSVLTIDDTGNSSARTANIDEVGGYNTISGLAPALIRFDSSDVSAATIRTGSGADTVNILRSDEVLTVTSSGGGDFVNVGNPTTGVQDITEALTVTNPTNFTSLSISDAGNTVGRTVTIDAPGVMESIVGLAPGIIQWDTRDIVASTPLPITLGSGIDNTSILRNRTPLLISTTGGFDIASVGNNTNGCDEIFTNVTFENPPSRTSLTVNDTGNTAGRVWTVNASGGFGRLGINASTEISYKLADASLVIPVTMNLGSGNDEVRVNGLELRTLEVNGNNGSDVLTVAGLSGSNAVITAPLTFNGGMGDDQFVAHGDSMANLVPWATFDGGPGFDTFTINDQTTPLGWEYTVFGEEMPAISRYNDLASFESHVSLPGVDRYTVNAGDQSDGLSVNGVDPSVAAYFNGGGQNDSAGLNIPTIRGTVVFDGQSGSNSLATGLNSDSLGQTVHITQDSIGAVPGDNYWGAGGELYFANVANIYLQFGSGPDTVYAQPNPVAAIALNGNDPTTVPGDALNLLLAGVVNPVITPTGPSDGQVTGDNVATLTYGSFETVAGVTPGGDFNNDGQYDAVDIDALVSEIAGQTNNPVYDLTQDGLVNLADRDAWLAEAGNANLGAGSVYLLGDSTLDGVVDGSDFGLWNANKFTNRAAWSKGDFNADGAIDGSDFGIWNGSKFTSSLGPVHTDWTSIDLVNEIATGNLNGSTVTFSGTDINFGISNGTSPFFNYPGVFTPSIANTDSVQFVSGSSSPHNYTLSFSNPVTNPTLHLHSLASVLTFSSPSLFTLVRLSGDATFAVSGNTVVGSLIPNPPVNSDSNGSVLIQGTFSQISFTSLVLPGASTDGINFQLSTAAGLLNVRTMDGSSASEHWKNGLEDNANFPLRNAHKSTSMAASDEEDFNIAVSDFGIWNANKGPDTERPTSPAMLLATALPSVTQDRITAKLRISNARRLHDDRIDAAFQAFASERE
jgi:Matrixin